MMYKTVVLTFDGKLHNTVKEAEKYLDVMYGELISKLSARLVAYTEGKYQRTQEFIDENLQVFVDLKQIKDNMELITFEEED